MRLQNVALLGVGMVGAGLGVGLGYAQARGIAAHTAPKPWYPISQVGAGVTGAALGFGGAYLGSFMALGGGMTGSKAIAIAGVAMLGAGFGVVGGTAWGMVREHQAR